MFFALAKNIPDVFFSPEGPMQGREFWKLIGLAVAVAVVVGALTALVAALLGLRGSAIGGAAGGAAGAIVATRFHRRPRDAGKP